MFTCRYLVCIFLSLSGDIYCLRYFAERERNNMTKNEMRVNSTHIHVIPSSIFELWSWKRRKDDDGHHLRHTGRERESGCWFHFVICFTFFLLCFSSSPLRTVHTVQFFEWWEHVCLHVPDRYMTRVPSFFKGSDKEEKEENQWDGDGNEKGSRFDPPPREFREKAMPRRRILALLFSFSCACELSLFLSLCQHSSLAPFRGREERFSIVTDEFEHNWRMFNFFSESRKKRKEKVLVQSLCLFFLEFSLPFLPLPMSGHLIISGTRPSSSFLDATLRQ